MDDGMAARVYRYRCYPEVTEEAVQQLRMATHLWNALVECQHRHLDRIEAAWRADPVVGPILASIDNAQAALSAVEETARAARKAARGNTDTRSARERADQYQQDIRSSYRYLKDAKKERRDLLSASFAASSVVRKSEEKAARQQYAQKGLYWGTYNAVFGAYRTAAQRARGAPLKFHPFRGEGRWHVQLQHEAADAEAPATMSRIMGGESRWRTVLQIDPVDATKWDLLSRGERRRLSRTTGRMRIGSNGRSPVWMEMRVILHRPLPAAAIIKEAEVVRERVGTHYRHHLCLTVLEEAPQVSPSGKVAAIDLGWRMTGRGLRVAAILGTDGHRHEVLLESSVISDISKADELASLRADKYNAIRSRLGEWLLGHRDGIPDWLVDATKTIAHWGGSSQARLASVVLRWRGSRFGGDETIYEELEAWRAHDKHLYEWQANLRDQAIARRKEQYRVLAARLADRYGMVVLEDMAITEMVAHQDPTEPRDGQADNARRKARIAAPGLLRQAISQAAHRRGVRVEAVDAARTTVVHATCGTDLSGKVDFASSVMAWCPTCEATFDQDFNACENLLTAATGEVRATR